MVRSVSTTIVCAAMLAAFARPALAQSAQPSASVHVPMTQGSAHSLTLAGSFGYAFMRTLGDDDVNLPSGWAASIDVTFNGRFGAIVDFASARQTGTPVFVPGAPGPRRIDSIQAGGRIFFRSAGSRVNPFAQLLAGKTRIVEGEDRHFSLQPGAGVDIGLGSQGILAHFGIRLQGDYLWIDRPGDSLSGFRFVAGVVIR